jgi:hypothetical protein
MKTGLRTLLALSLAFLPGCALVAGAGVGYVVYEKALNDSVHEAQVKDDVDRVWASVQETMDILVDPKTEPVVHSFPRMIQAKVDGADVEVEVETYDLERTVIRVRAEKYLGSDESTASVVMNKILDRLS